MVGALTKQGRECVKTGSEVGGQGLQVSETIKLLGRALASVNRTFICIDALDECSDKRLS